MSTSIVRLSDPAAVVQIVQTEVHEQPQRVRVPGVEEVRMRGVDASRRERELVVTRDGIPVDQADRQVGQDAHGRDTLRSPQP